MNKILITGGSGFIGSHLLDFLLNQNIPIKNLRLLIPHGESLKYLPNKKIEILRGSITDKKTVELAMKDINVVYHLAALTIEGGKYFTKSEYQNVNVLGTKNIIDACNKKNFKKLIFFSSIAVYGLPAWVGEINNWNEKQIHDPQEIYGHSKQEAEELIINAHKKFCLPYIIIRPTSVYGPRDKRNLYELFNTIRKHLFFYIGDGKNKMDYVYVKDLVKAAYLAQISKIINEDFIVGSVKPQDLNQVAKTISKSLKSKFINVYVPKPFAMILAYIFLYVSKTINIKPILFPERVRVLTTNCYFDSSKAIRLLKYQPKYTFTQGINETAHWMNDHENK